MQGCIPEPLAALKKKPRRQQMDELLTDLKLSDKHKAFSREAKAGGRLRRGGEEATERLSKLFWAGETVLGRQTPAGSACRGKGRAGPGFTWRDVARSVFPSGRRRRRRKGSERSPGSGRIWDERAALGGDNVVGLRWFPPVGSAPGESASAWGEAGDVLGIVSGSCGPICSPPVHMAREGEPAGFPLRGAGSRVNN